MVADMNIEDFRRLASVLAIHDAEWFADPSHVSASPHAGSLEARFYISRAGNLKAMIEIMGEVIRGGSAPLWVLTSATRCVLRRSRFCSTTSTTPTRASGASPSTWSSSRSSPIPDDIVLLNALGLASVAYHLSERGEELADRLVALVPRLRSELQQLGDADRTRLDPIVELATRRVAINQLHARAREFDASVDVYNSALELGRRAQGARPPTLRR